MFAPALFLAVWFAGAAATLAQFGELGGTLERIHAEERMHQREIAGRQAAHAAIREGLAETSSAAQPKRF
jgi:hypothetical protein